jgi:hypothetical protein
MIVGDFLDVGLHDKTRSLKVEKGSNTLQPTKKVLENRSKRKFQNQLKLYNDGNFTQQDETDAFLQSALTSLFIPAKETNLNQIKVFDFR